MFDEAIIDRTANVALRVEPASKHASNPLHRWTHDVPWPMDTPYTTWHLVEGVQVPPWEKMTGVLDPNVIWDDEEGLYKVWYYTRMYDRKLENKKYDDAYASWLDDIEPKEGVRHINLALCFMTSEDGLNWVRPALDVFRYKGEPTNIVLLGTDGGAGVIKDLRDPDPRRRYKLIARRWSKPPRIGTAVSPDGIHWSEFTLAVHAKGDTHTNTFWAPDIQAYVGISRGFDTREKVRTVVRFESSDFVTWSKPKEVLRGPKSSQIYTLLPSYYAPGYYIAVMSILTADGQVHAELAWSRDTRQWHRIDEGTPFIPNAEVPDGYDHGMIYPSAPLVLQDEVRFYYGATVEKHVTTWRTTSLNLATIGRDRFAGYEVVDSTQPGLVTTKPFLLTGEPVKITADVEDGGSLRVTVLNSRGEPMPGFDQNSCDVVNTSVTDHILTWRGRNLSHLRGTQVAFTIELNRAKVYSLSGRMRLANQ